MLNLVSAFAILAASASFTLPASAQDAAETEFVMGLMEQMNRLTISFNREVCGFVLQDNEGNYTSTKASWGGEASCASMPLEPGMRADLNLIDFDRLTVRAPRIVNDLPAGGARLEQRADGYLATLVAGQITYKNGEATDALPGRLIRSS